MADPWLYALDRRLGFDWWSYVRFFDAHPRLARIDHLIYLSMFPQLGVAAFALSLRRPAAATRFVAAIATTLAARLHAAKGALMPAMRAHRFPIASRPTQARRSDRPIRA